MQEQARASDGFEVHPPAAGEAVRDEWGIPLTSDSLHDLVGPVNQMRSMADLIHRKQRAHFDEDTEALFGFLQAASDKLENLFTGMRTYLRIVGQSVPHRQFDANAALDAALATLHESLDRSEARVTRDPLPEVYGDPNQISYAFASLIENSIKFRTQRRPEIHVSVQQKNGWLFSVCDNGIGIDPRHHDRIFAVFRRLNNEMYPGSGVGLAIARRIIERHGGRIWVESQLGQGATFFFRLPGTAGQAPA
jgi:light-regulated signal transduction histidine kinase (bacteriophytochrome)